MALPWQSGPEGMGFQGKIFFLQAFIRIRDKKTKKLRKYQQIATVKRLGNLTEIE